MDAIMIDSSDEAAETYDGDDPKLKNQYGIRNPIVYTTKLDDMKIFKGDTSDMDIDTIIDTIIKESKPKLNWKRKCAEATHSRCLSEDVSSHINTCNKKIARTAEHNKYPVCKPVKVVLVDLKHTLLRTQTTQNNLKNDKKTNSFENAQNNLKNYKKTNSFENAQNNIKNVKKTNSFENANLLTPKPATSISNKFKTYLIYDQQNKEADMYYLDKNLSVKEHNRFSIDNSDDHSFEQHKLNKKLSQASCCCWYKREQYLTSKMLGSIPHETLRFMRKPHKCAINLCRCCCRNQSISVLNDTSAIKPVSLKPSETPSDWLNKLTAMNELVSNMSSGSLGTVGAKPLCIVPKSSKKIYPVKPRPEDEMPYILHSTGVDFGEEYYAIGADGKIKFSLKNTGKDPQQLANLKLKMTNNILGNICCWFRREEFADRLLALGALQSTVKFIRTAHTCPATDCFCCCKPSNTKKLELTRINTLARHTNDLVSKKVNIKVRFTGVGDEPIRNARVGVTKKLTTKNKIVSFNLSLSALETISKSKDTENIIYKDVFNSIIPETFDRSERVVRVFVGKTGRKESVLIQCKTHLNDFSTHELTLLDMIFSAVNNTTQVTQQTDGSIQQKTIWKRTRTKKNVYGRPIYPLLLNTQLSVTTDLRNKRFIPPLRAHLEKYKKDFPEMVSNISVWMGERSK